MINESYKLLMKQIADQYLLDIRNRPIEFQKLLHFELNDELHLYLAEQRIIEGSKIIAEKRNKGK